MTPTIKMPHCGVWTAALLSLSLVLTLAIYWPGLSGDFLLDDNPNLTDLAMMHGVHSVEEALRFAFLGRSGPTGRPLALLTFLLNDNAWPSDPWSYKYTNLMLHLLNGLLLAWLGIKLLSALDVTQARQYGLAVVIASLWLAHPLNVSTVLYVIQRMTELATLFMVAGLLCYAHGRTIVSLQPRYGYACMCAGVAVCGLLAMLCKETGALLPLMVLVCEHCILRQRFPVPRGWSVFATFFLYLPLLSIPIYLIINWSGLNRGYERLDFTMGERLLTQMRVLTEYLRLVVVPRLAGTGLYFDTYQVSRGLWQPPSTVMCVALVCGMLILGLRSLRRSPVMAFGILWFFAGHVLESTILPLEIYFEHRNYLPLFGPLFATGYYLARYIRSGFVLAAGSTAFLVLFAAVTRAQAGLWGEPLVLAEVWASEVPTSVRAQQMAANAWLVYRNDTRAALRRLEQGLEYNPEFSSLKLQILQVRCTAGVAKYTDVISAIDALRSDFVDVSVADNLRQLNNIRKTSNCPVLSNESLLAMTAAATENAGATNVMKKNLHYLQGSIYAEAGSLAEAVRALDLAYEASPNIDIALTQASWLVSAGLYTEASKYVAKARRLDGLQRWPISGLRKKDIEWWEQIISGSRARNEMPSAINGSM